MTRPCCHILPQSSPSSSRWGPASNMYHPVLAEKAHQQSPTDLHLGVVLRHAICLTHIFACEHMQARSSPDHLSRTNPPTFLSISTLLPDNSRVVNKSAKKIQGSSVYDFHKIRSFQRYVIHSHPNSFSFFYEQN